MKYERLTERMRDGTLINKKCRGICKGCIVACDEALNRLAELEDKIEDGTLVELPCKKPCAIGDEYFIICGRDKIFDGKIYDINYDKKYGYLCYFTWKEYEFMVCNTIEIFGTQFDEMLSRYNIYKTKAEADAKLKELRGTK